MRIPPNLRSAAKWTALSACILLLTAFVLTLFWNMGVVLRRAPRLYELRLSRGTFCFVNGYEGGSPQPITLDAYAFPRRSTSGFIWTPTFSGEADQWGSRFHEVPLWMLLSVIAPARRLALVARSPLRPRPMCRLRLLPRGAQRGRPLPGVRDPRPVTLARCGGCGSAMTAARACAFAHRPTCRRGERPLARSMDTCTEPWRMQTSIGS